MKETKFQLTARVAAILDKSALSSNVDILVESCATAFLQSLLSQDWELFLLDTAFSYDDGLLGDLFNGVLDLFICWGIDDH